MSKVHVGLPPLEEGQERQTVNVTVEGKKDGQWNRLHTEDIISGGRVTFDLEPGQRIILAGEEVVVEDSAPKVTREKEEDATAFSGKQMQNRAEEPTRASDDPNPVVDKSKTVKPSVGGNPATVTPKQGTAASPSSAPASQAGLRDTKTS